MASVRPANKATNVDSLAVVYIVYNTRASTKWNDFTYCTYIHNVCKQKKKQIKAIDLSCFCRTRVIGHASTVATKYKKSEANHTWMTPPPKLSLRACKNSEGKPIILPSQSITNDSNSVQAGLEAFSAQYMETYRPMINGNGLINLEIDNMSWCIIVKSDATLLPK